MDNEFFRSDNEETFQVILRSFETRLNDFESEYKTNQDFLQVFSRNKAPITTILKTGKFNTFITAYKDVWNKAVDVIGSKNKYHNQKQQVFRDEEVKYTYDFRITNKDVLDFLETIPAADDKDDLFTSQKKYFKKFLSVTTLFCKAAGLYFYVDNANKVIVKKVSKESNIANRVEYYMFYNRSHVVKMQPGIATVIMERNIVLVNYYYKPTIPNDKYDELNTKGEISYYNNASILVLKNVKDIGSRDFYKSKEPVESFYVLKRYKAAHENMLLGILCTWNRDKSYPTSAAVLLIEKNYYDKQYGKGSPYEFKIEDIVQTKKILPRIYYFLNNQSITLESVIDENSNTATGSKNVFSDFDDIPFYKSEAEKLEKVAGRYKGLSIVPSKNSYLVILSELKIEPTGRVELNTISHNEANKKTSNENKGRVRFIEVDEDLNGRIFISLKYNFAKQYNAINHILEFKMKDVNHSFGYLKGAFAGQSLVTKEPVSATVIFERIEEDTPLEITKFEINEEEKIGQDQLIELYNQHQTLFKFFYTETDRYTNSKGVNFLRKILPLHQSMNIKAREKEYFDIFISIPLSSSNDQKEYDRNSKLVQQLKLDLAQEFNVEEEKIYCACMNGDKVYSYAQFVANNKSAIFMDIQEKIELVKTLILLYPQRLNKKETAISSSILEVGYAMALKKTIMMFYDSSEDTNLPKNLMTLYHNNTFTFVTKDTNPFQEMINMGSNHKRIAKLLM